MARKFYVYILFQRSNLKPLYIGKGTGRRVYQHRPKLVKGVHENIKLQRKINKLWENNDDFIEKIVQRFENENEAYNREIELIERYGGPKILCNITNGGEGSGDWWVGKHHSAMTKELKSIMYAGIKCPTTKLIVSDILYIRNSTNKNCYELANEYHMSVAAIYNIRAGKTFKNEPGKIWSKDEFKNNARLAISRYNKNRTMSNETKQKISNSLKSRFNNES